MCLYPRLINNPKYLANKKNGGRPPIAKDERVLKVPIGCGKCLECRKKITREWKVRLLEELRHNRTNAEFVTLTFDLDNLKRISNKLLKKDPELKGYALDNAIAIYAVKRFRKKWSKHFGKSPRYWLITELGHGTTEHMHMHGIIWSNTKADVRESVNHKSRIEFKKTIKKLWTRGIADVGDYVNERTVNYITKYCTKQDLIHKEYKPKILCSKGIGRGYMARPDAKGNKFSGKDTREYYTTREGYKLSLPIYYRNKLYTEDEREKLWLHKLDLQERFVLGNRIKVNNAKGLRYYYVALKEAQRRNTELGYGKGKDWKLDKYENSRRELIQERFVCKDITYFDKETGEIFVNPDYSTISLNNLKIYAG